MTKLMYDEQGKLIIPLFEELVGIKENEDYRNTPAYKRAEEIYDKFHDEHYSVWEEAYKSHPKFNDGGEDTMNAMGDIRAEMEEVFGLEYDTDGDVIDVLGEMIIAGLT